MTFDWVSIPESDFIYRGKADHLTAFRMNRNLVTNAQWNEFLTAPDGYIDDRWWNGIPVDSDIRVPATGTWTGDTLPRDTVNWHEASAFCRWASFKLGLTITLPSERQFERAASGTTGLKYPWGNTFVAGAANVASTATTPVGSKPTGASAEGILDLAGNLWEWCSDEVNRQI